MLFLFINKTLHSNSVAWHVGTVQQFMRGGKSAEHTTSFFVLEMWECGGSLQDLGALFSWFGI